jgi:hypothetical protein
MHPVEYVRVPIPVERRERKKVTSFSMPPSVKRRLDTYAKTRHMSASDLVTLLCLNFLESVAPVGGALETGKGAEEPSGSERQP